MWDDHEIENDYASATPQGGPEPLFASRRAAATQAYWEHMPFPKAWRPRGSELRLYERYDWGRLARIHTLDDRQYRDVQACPRRGRSGSKHHLLTDAGGIPLAVSLTGGNRHDVTQLAALLDAVRRCYDRFDDFEAFWTGKGWAEEGPVRTQSRIDVPRSGRRLTAGTTRIVPAMSTPPAEPCSSQK